MPSVTPDLMPPKAPLAPMFPLSDSARSLTLYPGAVGEVRVRWRLRADEVVGHAARFPSADGAPEVVLRLGRLHAGRRSEPVREQRLRLSGLSGSGEVAFRIGDDFGLFEAELGLTNPEGGWLLLARSNRLQSARGLGLESLRHPDFRNPPDAWSRPDAPGQPVGSEPPAAPVRPTDAVAVGTAERSETPPTIAGHSDTTDIRAPNAIPVLTYADPAPATTRVVIEAELRIHGWSLPDTEIDLFGHRYRVGPGGRFQLSVEVEDPELIRRALERHPPSGSVDPR
ncbi:MAG: hypothetical protein MZV65_43170 [Chromatiales bacterium]|nr:hypothetical protein [Chromatiales bacterium]